MVFITLYPIQNIWFQTNKTSCSPPPPPPPPREKNSVSLPRKQLVCFWEHCGLVSSQAMNPSDAGDWREKNPTEWCKLCHNGSFTLHCQFFYTVWQVSVEANAMLLSATYRNITVWQISVPGNWLSWSHGITIEFPVPHASTRCFASRFD